MADRLTVEALRDDGLTDEEIREALGLPEDDPLDSPVRRLVRERARSGPLAPPSVRDQIVRADEELDGVDGRLVSGRNTRPGPRLNGLRLSRGGKIKRVAEAMAKLQGIDWLGVPEATRRAYVRVAEAFVAALELVEAEEEELARTRTRADRVDRQLDTL